MIVLAIDTALDACAAAIVDTGKEKPLACESQPMARGHAEALMPLIARVVAASSLPFSSLDRIAVTTGPGSFTGLRVGLAAARGLALAAGRPVVGVTTLAAYAAPLIIEGRREPVVSAIDARHGQVYFQVWGGDGSGLVNAQVAPIGEVYRVVKSETPRLVGNAASMIADQWPADAPTPSRVETTPAPDIFWVAWLGAAADPASSPARPAYLKPPDAKPQSSLAGMMPVS